MSLAADTIDTVAEPFWQRWAQAISTAIYRTFWPLYRPVTFEESRLRSEVARLQAIIAERDVEVTLLRRDVESLNGTIDIQKTHMQLMVAVIERERLRVDAEQSKYQRRIAVAGLAKEE